MEAITEKKETIRHLKETLLSMEKSGTGAVDCALDFGLGPINAAFPKGAFPVGTIHEFSSPDETSAAAANGFLSVLLGTLMQKGGVCLWVSMGRKLFPPALKFWGIEPHRVIFIDVRQRADVLWVMEQGLRCSALSAVVAELRDVSFAESRRLQLAVENSSVTGFLHRRQPRTENALACVSRWKISPLPSQPADGLPGIGFPRWQVELLKIKNGRPGIWQFEWQNGQLCPVAAQKPAALSSSSTEKPPKYA